MKRIFPVFIAAGILAAISACNSQQDKTTGSLDDFINRTGNDLIKKENIQGLFIGVLNNGQRKYYSFGYADPDKKMPFDSATVFEIGSITKTFTAYALEMVLKEKGISDSSSIIQYLPDSVQQNKTLKNITFLSLLNHTSGLPRIPDNMDVSPYNLSPYDNYTLPELFAWLKTNEPGLSGKSSYSNLGAGLAGVLAERISEKSYSTLVNEYIFQPFHMTYYPDDTIASISNKGQGYFEKEKAVYWKAAALAPAGTLKCSATDMLTYLHGMATPSTARAKLLIDELLVTTASVAPNVNVCRAWHTLNEKDKPVIYWHNGGTYGFSTFGGFLRGKDQAVIVVANQFNKNHISDGLGFAILQKMIMDH